mgnify:CR=1 FL=1
MLSYLKYHLLWAFFSVVCGFVILNTGYNKTSMYPTTIVAKYEGQSCHKRRCRSKPMATFEVEGLGVIERNISVYTFTKVPENTVIQMEWKPIWFKTPWGVTLFWLVLPFMLFVGGITALIALPLSYSLIGNR